MGLFDNINVNLKSKIGWVELWDKYLTNLHHKNDSVSNVHPVKDSDLYADFTNTFSGTRNISAYFSIDGFESTMGIDYRTEIRFLCRRGVRANFIDVNEPYKIDWNNKETKNRFKIWSSQDKMLQGEVDEYNYAQNLSSLSENELRKESLVYVANAVLQRKREMFKTQQIMIISGERGREFDESVERIVEYMKKQGIKNTRIVGNIPEYLSVYSPFCLLKNPTIERTVGTNILPDEIISRYHTYSQGKVGRGTLYWGSDIENQFPILSEPKRDSTDAEIWLIIAETGGGKSYQVKGLVPQLLARKDMIGTINDMESEYLPLAYLVASDGTETARILDFGSDQGNFFDTVAIYLTGDLELDAKMYEDSYNFTIAVFQALGLSSKLANSDPELADWTKEIIAQGVTDAYRRSGVIANKMETWENSHGLRYQAVYERIKEATIDTNNEKYYNAKDLLLQKLSAYFEEWGAHYGKFSEEKRITLEQIVDAKLVINSFGMSAKSGESVDDTQAALMQLYTTQIGHIRAIFAKSRGMYNFKIFEEVQRWSKMGGSADILNATITGERKIGTITIVVSNKASDLLDNDTLGVFQNYTTIAIGAIADAEIRQRITERISMPLMLPELDEIAKQSKVRDEDDGGAWGMDYDEIASNPYAKAFMVYINRSEYAICKMRLPKALSESKLFKTGVDKDLLEQEGKHEERMV